jgi:lipopolysaccharide export system permease protein
MCVALLVLLGIFFLEHMHRTLPELLHCGASASQILALYGHVFPGFLPACIPISLFIAVLFGLGKLHANGEIVAMRTAGASLLYVTSWLWPCGIFFSALLFLLNGTVIPFCDERTQEITAAVKANQSTPIAGNSLRLNNLSYDNRQKSRLWLIGHLHPNCRGAEQVVVHFYGADGCDTGRLCAESGEYVDGHWRLRGVRETIFATKSEKSQVHFHEEKDCIDLDESPRLLLLSQRRTQNLSLAMVRKLLYCVPKEDIAYNSYATRYHTLIAGCWSPLIVIICAIPFAVCGMRTGPAINISRAILLLFLFHVVTHACHAFGSCGRMPPITAAWLPNGLLGTIGAFCLWRVR